MEVKKTYTESSTNILKYLDRISRCFILYKLPLLEAIFIEL